MSIKEELDEEKHKITKIKKSNAKTRSVRNLKIFGRVLNHIWPFALAGSLTVGVMSLTGAGLPFVNDEVKKKPIRKESIDSYGQEEYEDMFDEKMQESYIYFSGKACRISDGKALRHYTKYSLKNFNEETFDQLKKGEVSFSDLLGEKLEEGTDVLDNITEEELEDNNYYKAVIFDPNGKSILVKETSLENFYLTLVEIIATVFLGMSIDLFRGKYSDKWNKNTIKNIIGRYPIQDIKPNKEKIKALKKELRKEEI